MFIAKELGVVPGVASPTREDAKEEGDREIKEAAAVATIAEAK